MLMDGIDDTVVALLDLEKIPLQFRLIGSRFFKTHHPLSSYDFAAQDSETTRDLLIQKGWQVSDPSVLTKGDVKVVLVDNIDQYYKLLVKVKPLLSRRISKSEEKSILNTARAVYCS